MIYPAGFGKIMMVSYPFKIIQQKYFDNFQTAEFGL